MKDNIISWSIIFVCCIMTVEILLKSTFFSTVRNMNTTYHKIFKVLRSKAISDHWKEKVLTKYAVMLFRESIFLFLIMAIVFSPFIIAVYLSIPFSLNIGKILSTPCGMIVTTLIALTYGRLRKNYAKK